MPPDTLIRPTTRLQEKDDLSPPLRGYRPAPAIRPITVQSVFSPVSGVGANSITSRSLWSTPALQVKSVQSLGGLPVSTGCAPAPYRYPRRQEPPFAALQPSPYSDSYAPRRQYRQRCKWGHLARCLWGSLGSSTLPNPLVAHS